MNSLLNGGRLSSMGARFIQDLVVLVGEVRTPTRKEDKDDSNSSGGGSSINEKGDDQDEREDALGSEAKSNTAKA